MSITGGDAVQTAAEVLRDAHIELARLQVAQQAARRSAADADDRVEQHGVVSRAQMELLAAVVPSEATGG